MQANDSYGCPRSRKLGRSRNRAEPVDTQGPALPADLMQAARDSVLSHGPKTHLLTRNDGKRSVVKQSKSAARAEKELKVNQQLPTTHVFAPRMYGKIEVI